MILSTLDRYLLRRTLTPMTAVLVSTMVAFLMERLMRSFHLLSQTTQGFKFLTELLVNLVPHYVGLTLPGGFFIGLFVVVNSLNRSSEIDAILASGMSLGRFATPFVGLGVLLMFLSVLLFGFIQPYIRYA
jgi:lipopolysaccharide export system permease protein